MEITEKLKKLIILRDHPNTSKEEALNAAQAITRLLYKYNLEESNIPLEEKIINPIICKEINYKTKLCGGNWYTSLVTVITNNNLCKCLIISVPNDTTGRMYRDKFQLIGRKNNVEIVEYMIDSYANNFYKIGKRIFRNEYFGDLTENKFLRSFLQGCAVGLNQKYLELKQQYTDTKALIIKTDNEITEFLSNRNIRKGKKSKEQYNYDAYNVGYNVGKKSEINKGLTDNKTLLNARKS